MTIGAVLESLSRRMIGIQLKGRLGNQMFQYASARTLAEQLGCSLLTAGSTLGRRFGFIGHCLGLDERSFAKGRQQNGLLHDSFGRGPRFWQGRSVETVLPLVKCLLFPRSFSPRRSAARNVGRTFEVYDESFFDQPSGTWLSGWFQSENYFAANAKRVRYWFQADEAQRRKLDELITHWPRGPQAMVAMHVRRGDYAQIRDGLGEGGQGWLLPTSYYHNALERVPECTRLAICSDDPDWAKREFAKWRPWVSCNDSPVLDMWLIAQCRFNIIANSSFSWWGAWLNAHPDKVVFAPRYHLGWRIGEWVPGGIEVAGWSYLQVNGDADCSAL